MRSTNILLHSPWRPPPDLQGAFFILFFLLGSSASCFGAGLTLEEAVAKAVQNNLLVRQAIANQNESQHAEKESRSKKYPKLNQVTHYTTSDDEMEQLPNDNEVLIRANQTIFQGPLWSDIKRLRSLEKSAQAESDQKRLEVVLMVKQTYYRAVSATELLKFWDEAQNEFSSVLKFIAPKSTLGSVPEFDYAKLHFDISQFQQSELDSQKELSHQLFLLGEIMATDPPASVEPLPDVNPPPKINISSALDVAFPNRPDLQAAEAMAEAGSFDVAKAQRERWPVVTIGGDYGYSAERWVNITTGWEFTGQINIPLFDFGEIRSRVNQAHARQQSQQYQLEALKLKIRTELNDQIQTVETSWEKLWLIRETLPETRQAYESSLRRYRTGLAPMTELSDAHDLWVQARTQLSQALSDYRIALAELYAAQGLWGIPK